MCLVSNIPGSVYPGILMGIYTGIQHLLLNTRLHSDTGLRHRGPAHSSCQWILYQIAVDFIPGEVLPGWLSVIIRIDESSLTWLAFAWVTSHLSDTGAVVKTQAGLADVIPTNGPRKARRTSTLHSTFRIYWACSAVRARLIVTYVALTVVTKVP